MVPTRVGVKAKAVGATTARGPNDLTKTPDRRIEKVVTNLSKQIQALCDKARAEFTPEGLAQEKRAGESMAEGQAFLTKLGPQAAKALRHPGLARAAEVS